MVAPTLPIDLTVLDASMIVEVLTKTSIGLFFMGFLTILAGLLVGKEQSDAARNGTGPKEAENLNWLDWAQDAAYGAMGIPFCIAAAMAVTPDLAPMILITMPAFGYQGRKMLLNYGAKVGAEAETGTSK